MTFRTDGSSTKLPNPDVGIPDDEITILEGTGSITENDSSTSSSIASVSLVKQGSKILLLDLRMDLLKLKSGGLMLTPSLRPPK